MRRLELSRLVKGNGSSIWYVLKIFERTQKFTSSCKINLNPAGIYLFKISNRKTRARCEICSKLTIKTPERCQWMIPLEIFGINNNLAGFSDSLRYHKVVLIPPAFYWWICVKSESNFFKFGKNNTIRTEKRAWYSYWTIY